MTDRWRMIIQPPGTQVSLPHRLFRPFSLELNGRTEHEAVIDFQREEADRARGTESLPPGLSFEFRKEGR